MTHPIFVINYQLMSYRVCLVFLWVFIFSCDTQSDKEVDNHSIKIDSLENSDDQSISNKESDKIWVLNFDEQHNEYKPKKVRSTNLDQLTPAMVVAVVNKTWPEVQVKYLKTVNDTVFISIPKSIVLTQQMGTQGAMEFMITTTFTFTELKGIHQVSFDFEEGDHAVPGVYNRHSWDIE
jgi:hypothetical protein